MSSFKRRVPSSASDATLKRPIVGVRQASGSSVALISSGIPSFDDILGGGLPTGSVTVVLTPDLHSAWGTLIQRYFIAQGLHVGHVVRVVSEIPHHVIGGCMWVAGSRQSEADSMENDEERDSKMKIAWRYEKMNQFQTSVTETSLSSEGYCSPFDLTIKIPGSVISDTAASGQLSSISILDMDDDTLWKVISELRSFKEVSQNSSDPRPIRLSILDLGGPAWGDCSTEEILKFLYLLRHLIHSTNIAALVTIPPHLSLRGELSSPSDDLLDKIGFFSHACISFTGFGADPSLSSLSQTYHGAVHLARPPSLHTLLPFSHRHSVLRGSSNGGENNLAFKCTRKRFMIETLHLDVEGGVGERRTTPGPSAIKTAYTDSQHDDHAFAHPHVLSGAPSSGANATINITLDDNNTGSDAPRVSSGEGDETTFNPPKGPPSTTRFREGKPKKRVAFRTDRPDMYDF